MRKTTEQEKNELEHQRFLIEWRVLRASSVSQLHAELRRDLNELDYSPAIIVDGYDCFGRKVISKDDIINLYFKHAILRFDKLVSNASELENFLELFSEKREAIRDLVMPHFNRFILNVWDIGILLKVFPEDREVIRDLVMLRFNELVCNPDYNFELYRLKAFIDAFPELREDIYVAAISHIATETIRWFDDHLQQHGTCYVKALVDLFPEHREDIYVAFMEFLSPPILPRKIRSLPRLNPFFKCFPEHKVAILLALHKHIYASCEVAVEAEAIKKEELMFGIQDDSIYHRSKKEKSLFFIVGVLTIRQDFLREEREILGRFFRLYPEFAEGKAVFDDLFTIFNAIVDLPSAWLVNVETGIVMHLITLLNAIKRNNIEPINELIDAVKNIRSYQKDLKNIRALSVFVNQIVAQGLVEDPAMRACIEALNDVLVDCQVPSLFGSCVRLFAAGEATMPEGGLVIRDNGTAVNVQEFVDHSNVFVNPLMEEMAPPNDGSDSLSDGYSSSSSST